MLTARISGHPGRSNRPKAPRRPLSCMKFLPQGLDPALATRDATLVGEPAAGIWRTASALEQTHGAGCRDEVSMASYVANGTGAGASAPAAAARGAMT
ncbi:hypothetical protein SDC9_38405 [bioreactor metagenome]|uniref:Uncharacterized protein n=1 Tax=bioreactor metagenome TaxID=1076179 RepID=A0A644VM32_9ZZZZ